jgi:arginine decarboxylase
VRTRLECCRSDLLSLAEALPSHRHRHRPYARVGAAAAGCPRRAQVRPLPVAIGKSDSLQPPGRRLCGEVGYACFFHTIFTNRCVRFALLRSIQNFLEENELGKDMVPKKIFFTKGVGKHRERLTSFELALRDAGIAAQNLVRVSSIFPPNCKLVPRSQGLTYLSPGEVVFAVVAENSTHEPHRLLASSIGVAIPADRNTYGYLSEHHSFGETEDAAGDYAEELAAEMLATTLNVEFDSDRSWDEKKEIYRISNKIVRTANVTQSAVGDKRGLWTTVIASAVLIFD